MSISVPAGSTPTSVRNCADEADKRRKLLVLTQAGQEMMAGLFTAVSPIEAPIRAELGEEDMARLTELTLALAAA